MEKIQPVPLRDRIHEHLFSRIINGELAPGVRIRDTEVSQALGVSRTPVREALIRLAREGLLENRHHRGFIVTPLTAETVAQTYPIIRALECRALRDVPALSDRARNELYSLNARIGEKAADTAERIRLDNAWHHTLLAGCGNARLLQLLAEQKAVVRRYEFTYMVQPDLVRRSMGDHETILNELEAGNRDAAVRLLDRHWQQSMTDLLARIHDTKSTGESIAGQKR